RTGTCSRETIRRFRRSARSSKRCRPRSKRSRSSRWSTQPRSTPSRHAPRTRKSAGCSGERTRAARVASSRPRYAAWSFPPEQDGSMSRARPMRCGASADISSPSAHSRATVWSRAATGGSARRIIPIATTVKTSLEPPRDPSATVSAIDWPQFEKALDADGYALARGLLPPAECAALIQRYPDDRLFRSTIVMARHGFGQGEYRYFAYPLPEILAVLRTTLYAHLAPIANRWNEALGITSRYPSDHEAYLARCHRAGQKRPTPLILRYGVGDYNCLHQDLYGEHVFPLQATI